jgi:hypothetical protein
MIPNRVVLFSMSVALSTVAVVGACDPAAEDCVAGKEGCACREDQCLSGLECRSAVCVDPNSDDEDDEEQTGEESEGGEPACDASRGLTIGGALETDVSSVVFDRAEVLLHHKRDVDEFEDGCINDVVIQLAAGEGCVLQVYARDLLTPQSRLMVADVQFSADSQCPNFPDANEGQYIGTETLIVDGTGVDGLLTIPQENAASACFNGEYTLHLAGSLSRGDQLLAIYPSQITLQGDFRSTAVDRSCPVFP